MTTSVDAPPIDQLAGEFVATLCMAGLAYAGKDDLESATLACDLVAAAFERIHSRLRDEDRAGLTALVTELRMSIVRKRGP